MDSTRALALLWRATLDPSNAALIGCSVDGDAARRLATAGFGRLETRARQPHQVSFAYGTPIAEHPEYFVANDKGRALWIQTLGYFEGYVSSAYEWALVKDA